MTLNDEKGWSWVVFRESSQIGQRSSPWRAVCWNIPMAVPEFDDHLWTKDIPVPQKTRMDLDDPGNILVTYGRSSGCWFQHVSSPKICQLTSSSIGTKYIQHSIIRWYIWYIHGFQYIKHSITMNQHESCVRESALIHGDRKFLWRDHFFWSCKRWWIPPWAMCVLVMFEKCPVWVFSENFTLQLSVSFWSLSLLFFYHGNGLIPITGSFQPGWWGFPAPKSQWDPYSSAMRSAGII